MLPKAPAEPWFSAYGLGRATADIDVISVVPYGSASHLLELAGKESALRTRHGIYLDIVTVASVPESYETRLTALYPECRTHLRLFVLEAPHLARSGYLKAATLHQRDVDEMRPYVIGRESWHDQTLAVVDRCVPERGANGRT